MGKQLQVSVSVELSVAEARKLEACEADINRGGEMVARALQVIRDEKLYRAEYPTFEQYCREKLNKGRLWAHRQIMHIEVLALIAGDVASDEGADSEPDDSSEAEQNGNLGKPKSEDGVVLYPLGYKTGDKNGETKPAERKQRLELPERVTRELSGLTRDQINAVLEAAQADGSKLTAKSVRAAREKLFPAPKSEPVKEELRDELGLVIPESIHEVAQTSAAITNLRSMVSGVKRELKRLRGLRGGEHLPQELEVDNLDAGLACARFWTTCPMCDGSGCVSCRNLGWLRRGVIMSNKVKQALIARGAKME
jgi:hypothetical protein